MSRVSACYRQRLHEQPALSTGTCSTLQILECRFCARGALPTRSLCFGIMRFDSRDRKAGHGGPRHCTHLRNPRYLMIGAFQLSSTILEGASWLPPASCAGSLADPPVRLLAPVRKGLPWRPGMSPPWRCCSHVYLQHAFAKDTTRRPRGARCAGNGSGVNQRVHTGSGFDPSVVPPARGRKTRSPNY